MRRYSSQNERSLWSLDIRILFGLTFGLKKSYKYQFKELNHPKFCSPLDFYLPTWETFAPPFTSLDLAQNLSSDWFGTPLPYTQPSIGCHVTLSFQGRGCSKMILPFGAHSIDDTIISIKYQRFFITKCNKGFQCTKVCLLWIMYVKL